MNIVLRDKILDYVEKYDHVTFAELAIKVKGFASPEDAQPQLAMTVPGQPNMILWVGLTEEAVECLNTLMQEKKIWANPAHWFCYLADGSALRFPLVKGNRIYKKPHWLPVVFRPGAAPPLKKAKSAKGRKLA